MTTLDGIDLLEDTWASGVPHDQFDLLRRDAPVYWHEHPDVHGFWAVTQARRRARGQPRPRTRSPPSSGRRSSRTTTRWRSSMVRMTLLNMDPPKHSRYRRLVSAGLHAADGRPDASTTSRERAADIVDEIEGRDEIDFVEEIAAELPLQVICEMIGVPEEDLAADLRLEQPARRHADDPDFRRSEEAGQTAAGGDLHATATRSPPTGARTRATTS